MNISGNDIRKLRIGLASPEEVRSWSKGEVTESETFNYRTHRPERGGLFAEEIFGPERDHECACGKYRGRKYEGIKCEKCGVLVTDKSVRRVNMGHIELASPVIHFWFLKGISSPLSTLLGLKRAVLKRIAYYETETKREELFVVTASPDGDPAPGEYLYKSQVEILSKRKKFSAEPAYLVESAPAVVAEEEGVVQLAPMKLENGEDILVIKVGGKDYPVSPKADLSVEEGDEVRPGDVLAPSPVGEELLSEFKFNAFRKLYPEVRGTRAVEDVDNLIHLVTRVTGEDFPLKVGDLLLETEKRAYERVYRGQFEAHTGALGVKGVLENLDLDGLARELVRQIRAETSEGKRKRLYKRLEVVEQLRGSGNRPQDMVLEVIPVLPPDLRPIVQLEGGKFATTDLNDLYRRIINRNNRLKKLQEMGAPEVILRNERRMLQEAVDALIHNEKKENPILGRDNRPLKSLSERIQGKQGRLRRNLLGKRVDYSGRAVIVVNPRLKLHQCGLPKKMALELFRPFIHQRLEQSLITNFDELKNKALSGELPEVWDVLERLIKEYPVLLNRAPTLHRLGIQAFEPVLVDGEAIQIHPYVCPPYNADFDGDQMAVHLPLSPAAVREARELMLSSKNILSPANGEPLTMPTQDLIFASYYLTCEMPAEDGDGQESAEGGRPKRAFANLAEAERAYDEGLITLQTPVAIRIDSQVYETTLGRVKFNRLLPEDLRDYQRVFDADAVEEVVMRCYHRYGLERTVQLLDDLKDLCLYHATRSGLTISVRDCLIPPAKAEILASARERVNRISRMYELGLSTEEERADEVIKVWRETVDRVERATMENFAKQRFNPVYAIVKSGARGSANQVKQLSGMRGPMADPSGRIIEMPVIANFREGLNVMEYFISTHGGRKGTADTALKTADSGYLTRRLVDATEELIIKEEDCGTHSGIEIDPLYYGRGQVMEDLETRLYGRLAAQTIHFDGQVVLEKDELVDREKAKELAALQRELEVHSADFAERAVGTKSVSDVRDPETGTVIVAQDERITPYLVERLRESGVERVRVRPNLIMRSVLSCETQRGLCQKCYGLDLSKHQLVELGTAVGVIAAQSIGEPGTQLTMRTFHTGGVAGEDITQGLPRAEELFEARKALKSPQGEIAPISGWVVALSTTPDGREQVHLQGEERRLRLPQALCRVQPGDRVAVKQFISTKSPRAGELRMIRADGRRRLLLLDEGDRVYFLPPGVEPRVKSGRRVEAGQALSAPYNEEAAGAQSDGKVEEIITDGERHVVVRDRSGGRTRYRIPYGARLQVGVGDAVKAGDKLSTRSVPITLTAERAGVAWVQRQEGEKEGEGKGRTVVIVYEPQDDKELPLTGDVTVLVPDGSRVKANEELFALALEAPTEGGTAVVDVVESLDEETVEVRYHFEADVPLTSTPIVHEGDKVREGALLSKGVVDPHLLLKTAGAAVTRDYLLTEIHKVYKSQGVDINDKHIELVIRQMLNKVSIQDAGDSPFAPNQIVLLEEFRAVIKQLSEENRRIALRREEIVGLPLAEDLVDEEGNVYAQRGQRLEAALLEEAVSKRIEAVKVLGPDGEPEEVRIRDLALPVGERVLLRISRSALETKSWLSAASFQRTTTVLAEAALRGAVDELESLKSSVIVSRLIPAGTGYHRN